ncbi:MAG: asparagine synthase (glutamine-hydrolyzing) [Vicinamibacterales bacterium]
MCGFVAVIGPLADHERAPFAQATRLLAHRGPDDEVIVHAPTHAFGFRRLNILDLTTGGRQPMSTADGRFTIVFNGEIYNYRELRHELQQLGHAFHSTSDTEVLLHAYVQWGEACLSRLNGMFAFLIWDGSRERVFGARDRFGEKPLYYCSSNGRVVFASEIKALVPLLGRVPDINCGAMASFVAQGSADTTAETFFQGVQAVPPGHFLRVVERGLHLERYWSLQAQEREVPEPVEQLKALFVDAVRVRTRSDVPLGVCLSGGLDSSSIAGILAQEFDHLDRAVTHKAFSAVYPDYDESAEIAAIVAATRAEDFAIEPIPTSLAEIEELLWYQDEPFHSFTVYASYRVMALAREHDVTVLLNGQGADELLGGYKKYLKFYLASLLAAGEVGSACGAWMGSGALTGQSRRGVALDVAATGARFAAQQVPAWANRAWRPSRARLASLTEDFAAAARRAPLRWSLGTLPDANLFKQRLYVSLFATHLPLYLRVEDRNSMAHSLESRLPFLDHRLAEFVFALPTRLFMAGGSNKHLFREAMRGVVPELVRRRRMKFGFPVPAQRILAGLRSDMLDLFGSQDIRESGIVDGAALAGMLARQEGPIDVDFWFRALSAALWLRSRRRLAAHARAASPALMS